MSITEQRLKDYQLQMSIYAEQHKMLLASDVLDMIEQLQDDLKDDVDEVVEKLKGLHEGYKCIDNEFQRGAKAGAHYVLNRAIEIVKGGGVNEQSINFGVGNRV